MFARTANDGGDDPYNFDIVDGYGGGGSKKSKKSKLGGKASLNKTVGASPSTSSLIPQESGCSLGPTTTIAVLKDPLRASAPAGPTSALDKAMSFLNKYKQGASSAATAKGANSFRKSLDAANTTFDEDEMDMSFSSDSDAAGRSPGRKAPSRLKASRDEPRLEPRTGAATAGTERNFASRSLTLSGMRASGRFDTAKELGISESAGLEGPKAAVSPIGIQNRSTKSSEGVARYQADACSPSEHQSSGLRLVVNIPGESSTYGSPVKHGSGSDIESVGSVVAEALEEQTGGEDVFGGEPWLGSLNSELAISSKADPGGSSDLVNPTLEQQSGSATNLNQDSRGASGRGLAQSPPDRSAIGKVMSVDDLATVSRPQIPPNPRGRGANAEDGRGSESSERNRRSYAAEGEDDDDEEDDYGDDDFEDQDVLMESIGETAPVTEGHNTISASTTRAPSHVSCVGQSTIPARGAANNQEHGVLPRPLEAWSRPPADKEAAQSLPGTSDSHTSPRSIDWKDGRAPPGTREAWGEKSARESCAKGDKSTAPAATGGIARPLSPNTDQCRQQGDNSARGTGTEETNGGSLSRRGVLIDRSIEASNPIRPSDMKVNVIARVEAVASVEYAHDPESGLNLRSCGTQMVGNSAAVQANIAVPGMAGTHTSVKVVHTTASTHAPGVGYQTGEPYGKCGRFACEKPAGCSLGRDPYAREGVWEHPSPNSSRRHPRVWGGIEADANAGLENDDGNGGGSSASVGVDPAGRSWDGGAAHLDNRENAAERFGGRDATRTPTIPSVRGGSAYLETFLDVMAKSQAETCDTWQKVLETAAPRRVPASPDEQVLREEKTGTAAVVDGTEPCSRDGAAARVQERYEGPSEVDMALHRIMTATQDSFRRQLADMRENLTRIRYRAEVAGRQGYAHNYESVTDVRDYLARARPPATRPAEALMKVDPSLTLENAETLADGGTVPSSPVEH